MDLLTISPECSGRLRRWLVGGYKLAPHHGGFPHVLAGLGRLDCALRSFDATLYSFVTGGAKVGEPANLLTDFHCLSDLWTMGMYEVLRTLNQKLDNDAKRGKKHPAADDARLLKDKLGRVRIPLAKFERARKFRNDYDYLSQMAGKPDGWGWIVADKTIIYRNELADEVLELFDKFDETEISTLFKRQST